MSMRRFIAGLALAALLTGCTALPGSPNSPTSAPAVSQPATNTGTTPAAPANPQPFAMAHVTAKLTAAGFADAQVLENTVNAETFGVPGQVIKLKDADLHVYIYADEAARSQVTVGSDPSHIERPGGHATIVEWVVQPRVVIKGNLIVFIFAKDASVQAKLATALEGL